MKKLGPCEVPSCGKGATRVTDADERFCREHDASYLVDRPGDDWADDDGLDAEDFAA